MRSLVVWLYISWRLVGPRLRRLVAIYFSVDEGLMLGCLSAISFVHLDLFYWEREEGSSRELIVTDIVMHFLMLFVCAR